MGYSETDTHHFVYFQLIQNYYLWVIGYIKEKIQEYFQIKENIEWIKSLPLPEQEDFKIPMTTEEENLKAILVHIEDLMWE